MEEICLDKNLIKVFGLEEAVILGELVNEYIYYKQKGILRDDYFCSTIYNIEDNTGINEYKQRNALKHLEKLKIIEIKYIGLPAHRYIKINTESIYLRKLLERK